MSGVLMDKVIQELGGKQWVLTALETPAFQPMESLQPISVSEFVSDACRPCTKSVKSMNVLFDVHVHIPQCGKPAELVQEMAANVDNIPPAINCTAAIPKNPQLTSSSSPTRMAMSTWSRSLEHQERSAVAPQSSWWSSTSVAYFAGKGYFRERLETNVSPSNAEIEEGILFIDAQAPECDAQNEQTLWILISIKPDSGTPIALA
eukprot:s234_g18.t1